MKRKTAWMALALGLMLLLSGCNIVEKNADRDAAQVVATVGGEDILKAEFLDALNTTLASYGMTAEDLESEDYADIADTFREQVLEMLVNSKIELIKARELGYDQLSADEEAEIDQSISDLMDTWTSSFTSTVQSEDASAELTEEEIAQEVETRIAAMREENGYTDDYIRGVYTEQLMTEKLYDSITGDITATEEQIQATYDTAVSEAKTSYEEDASNFEYDMFYGSTIYYYPEEARRVKHILVGFSEEDKTAISEARNSGEDDADETADALRDEAAAALQDRVDEVMEAIGDGSDATTFDTVMQEMSDDPGKTTNPDGYIVTASTTQYMTEFRDGAMAIEAVGGITTVVTDAGIHIIRYEEAIPVGAVSLDSVRDEIEELTLSDLRSEAYSTQIEQWREELEVVTYADRLS